MRFLLLLILFVSTEKLFSQKKCSFQLDTARILKNQDLDKLLSELKIESFKITNNKRDIPRFIKKELNCYVQPFKIANPNHPYNSTDLIIRGLPERQLIFLANSASLFVMQYNQGGIALIHHLLVVKHKEGKILELWKGVCVKDLMTIEDVVKYLELNRNQEWGLNTNVIYF